MRCRTIVENGRLYDMDLMSITRVSDNVTIKGILLYKVTGISDILSQYGSKPYKKIILSYPATIVIWNDGTKTVVKCQEGEHFDKEKGVAMCFMKKFLGNKSNFNNVFRDCGALNEGVKDE